MNILKMKLLTFKNTIFAWLAICFGFAVKYFVSDPFEINETQAMYLFSTAAQVLAGIFGLMVTANIFLKNELDRQTQIDSSLFDAVRYLKVESHKHLLIIGVLTTASIFGCLYAIAGYGNLSMPEYDFVINVVISGILLDVAIIIAFSVVAISPDNITDASNEILESEKFNSSQKVDSLEQFISKYNLIESLITNFMAPYAPSTSAMPYINIRGELASHLLVKHSVFTPSEFNELKNLVEYRNALIHGSDLTVSDNMLHACNRLYAIAKSKLDAPIH